MHKAVYSKWMKLQYIQKKNMKKRNILLNKCINGKEGNDQESIQLPNTFRPKTPKGKKDALKVTAPQSKHYKQKAKRTVSFKKKKKKKWPNNYPK